MPDLQDKQSKELKDLKKLWTKQLYLEYERICYQFRLKLDPVVITLADFRGRWGDWNPWTRTISIACSLIENYRWEIVVEVLKHEMAHQMVSELFRSSDGHGAVFKEACRCLGMSEWAMASALPLAEKDLVASKHSLSSAEESLLRRAKKLLALAASSNEHEAFLAMKKVQELYDKYHLEHIIKLEKPKYATALINHHKKRVETYQAKIFSLLVRHFHVQAIYTTMFDAQTCQEHKAIELFGAPHHVEMAEYVYWFLFNNLKCLWQEHKQKGKQRQLVQRNNFLQGVVAGFDEKLQKARNEKEIHLSKKVSLNCHDMSNTSLLVREEQRLASFVAYRYPRLRTTTYSYGATRDWDAYRAGQKKGRELNLHKGVATRDGYKGKLLEG